MKGEVTIPYLEKFELVSPIRGGVKEPRWTLRVKTGDIRINKFGIENERLWEMKFVEIRTVKENDKIMVLVRFSKEKKELESAYALYHYEDEKKNKSLTFSGKGIFRKFNIRATDITKEKSITLNPEVKNIDEKKFFYFEISLKK